jgi:hypothetical protein
MVFEPMSNINTRLILIQREKYGLNEKLENKIFSVFAFLGHNLEVNLLLIEI